MRQILLTDYFCKGLLSSELINQVVVVARIAVDGAGRAASNQRQVGNGQIGRAARDAVGVLIVKHPSAHLRFARQYQVAARLASRRPGIAAEVSRDFRHARALPVQDGVQPLQDVHLYGFGFVDAGIAQGRHRPPAFRGCASPFGHSPPAGTSPPRSRWPEGW